MSERLQALANGSAEPAPRGFSGWIGGRARRREYWLWVVPLVILGFALAAKLVPGATLAMGLPILFVWIRRLHDLGYSGWFAPVTNVAVNLTSLAAMGLLPPAIGGLISLLAYLAAIITLGVLPGQGRRNEYGAPPGRREETEVFS